MKASAVTPLPPHPPASLGEAEIDDGQATACSATSWARNVGSVSGEAMRGFRLPMTIAAVVDQRNDVVRATISTSGKLSLH